jgi:hypothetical protein
VGDIKEVKERAIGGDFLHTRRESEDERKTERRRKVCVWYG